MDDTRNFCGACGVELTNLNWYSSLRKHKNYRCVSCFTHKLPKAYCSICGLRLQQGQCFQCVLTKENRCAKCQVLLTEKNWPPSFRKRRVRRCSPCHAALSRDWDARNPGHAAKRTKKWQERNPEHRPAYYEDHKEEYAQRAINRLWKHKMAAITLLGGKCVICGITDMRLLQINHLNGRGEDKDVFGENMYKLIVKGIRTATEVDVRCANHNLLYEYERGKRRAPVWFSHDEMSS